MEINSRYARQTLFPDFGEEKQKLLAEKRVFIAGAGGLGSIVSYYLSAAGVGTIQICDHDAVNISNLNRQILHSTSRIGMAKTDSAEIVLKDLNPEVRLIKIHEKLADRNSRELISGSDLVIDCLDSMQARHVLNRACVSEGIPFIHGGIQAFCGQLTFFNPPETGCLACLFPETEEPGGPIPVFGPAAGIIGSFEALEAIKFLSGLGTPLYGTLLYIDGLSSSVERFSLSRIRDCPVCGNRN